MIEDLLPPSPNWYCSQASDSNGEGLFAYATRNVVYLLDVRKNQPCLAGCLAGHSNRVTAVRFSRGGRGGAGGRGGNRDSYLCVTAGDDGCVKLWDVRNKSVVNEQRLHDENKVTAADWCVITTSSTGLILTGDEKGSLICWNHVSGENKEFVPERKPVYCLASCPHDGAFVAVGYKTGLVLIVDISDKGQIIHKLRGHDEEIHSVCWSPALGEKISLQPQGGDEIKTSNGGVGMKSADDVKVAPKTATSSFKDQGCLLLSGSRDRTIRVWNTTQGKAVMTLNLPPRAGFHRTRERGDDGGKARVWLALSWHADQPRRFLSSSHGGDIVLWDLCIPGKQKWEHLGTDDSISHSRIVFSVTNMCPFLDDTFITTSMDRQIICWSTKTRKAVWTLPTLGGFVYSLSACPVDPRCLALGVGDNMIRVWNTTSPGKDNAVSVLWQGIKSKVTALSWHPERDNCLAYGTDDGRVGIYNTFTQGKSPHLSSTFHKKTVYSLNWGPQCPFLKEGGMSYCLFSCGGDGIIYQHNPSKLGEDATNFNSLIRSANQITYMLPLRTDVSWRGDWKAVAIGNEDGSIEVFAAPSLLQLCTIQVHHKLINCLQWYPCGSHSEASVQLPDQSAGVLQDGSDGSGQSGRRYWLASGSNEPQVLVHDLASVLGGIEPVQLKAPITGAFRTLNGHTLRITALSWSPHGNGYLVSASYDGTAQVWDVANGQPVANFRGHLGRLFSVVWSGLDPDVVFTGGEDFCLLKWRVSSVQHTKPPAHKRNTVPLQRSGKNKSAAASKSSRRKSKPPRDAASVSDTPAESAAPDDEPPASKPSARRDLPAAGSVNEDIPPDMSELQKLLEEKRLEMMKDAVTKDDLPINDEVGGATKDALDTEKIISDPRDITVDVRERERLDEGVPDTADVSETQVTDAADATFRKEGRRKKKHRSLFPLSRSQDNRGKVYHLQDCVTVAQHKYGSQAAEQQTELRLGEGDGVHLGLFADRRAAYAMFREEGSHHDDVGYHEQSQQLEMWKGNLAGALTKATESNQLSSFLVAMAPLGGYDVWLETTEAYARQLERSQDYIQASTYYLACHKIHKAIRVLVDNKLFREAVALASVRLSGFDPAFSDVYLAWASHLESEGNYAQAAKCYLTINRPADAVMLLARKSDIPTLAAALRISFTTDQGNLSSGLMVRYLHECLMAGDWSEAQTLLTNHRSVLSGSLVALLHELIVMTLLHQKLIPEDLFQETRPSPWIQAMLTSSSTQTMDDISGWVSILADQSPLLTHAVDKWFVQCGLDPGDDNDVQRLYNEVTDIRQQPSQHMSEKQLLIALAFEMTLGQLSLMMGGASRAASHWLQAVVMCHDVADMNTSKGILSLVLPEGEQSFKKLQCYPVSPASSADVTSLRAYYLSTVLYHLWWEVGNILLLEKAQAVLDEDSSMSDQHGTETDEISAVEKSRHPSRYLNNGIERPLSQLEPARNGMMTDDQDTAHASCEVSCESVLDRRSFLEETLFKQLSKISKTLLSEPHAKLKSLKGRLQCIQIAAANMVARHAREGRKREGSAMDATSKVADSTGWASERNGSSESDARPGKGAVSLQELSAPQQASNPNRDSANIPEESSSASTVLPSTKELQELAPTIGVSLTSCYKEDPTSAKEIDLPSTDSLDTTSSKEIDSTSQEQPNLPPVETAPKWVQTKTNGHPDQVHRITENRLRTDFNYTGTEVSDVLDQEEVPSSGASLPSDWDSLMADVKYSHPAVTYAELMAKQGRLLQELQKLGQDFEVHNPFPDTVESALVILHVCRTASQRMNVSVADRSGLRQLLEKAKSWSLQHSWLTCQREAIW